MGKVVAAVFTTHVPRLMIVDPVARRAYMGRNVTTFYDAMPKLERERLHHLDFDTFLVIDTHWFSTLEYVLNAHERLSGVYTSEELPAMLHDLEYDYRGDPELARGIEIEARERGIRAIASAHRNLPLHYPTLNVMYYFNHDAPPGAHSQRVSNSVGQKRFGLWRGDWTGYLEIESPGRDRGVGRNVAQVLGLRSNSRPRIGVARRHRVNGQSPLRRTNHGMVQGRAA